MVNLCACKAAFSDKVQEGELLLLQVLPPVVLALHWETASATFSVEVLAGFGAAMTGTK